jgi:hypothetical protein
MYCYKCGKQCQDDARFCTRCGANISVGILNGQPMPPRQAPPQFYRPPVPQTSVPTVYIYRDATVPKQGSFKAPLWILLLLSLLGLVIYFSISLNPGRTLQDTSCMPAHFTASYASEPENFQDFPNNFTL